MKRETHGSCNHLTELQNMSNVAKEEKNPTDNKNKETI